MAIKNRVTAHGDRKQSHFATIPSAEISRSSFNRSHGVKTTFDSGLLVPIYVDEMLPGDTINLKVSTFARMATPLKPVMDNQHLDLFFFAVPLRLLWDNFERFMGAQDDPADSTDFTVPQLTVATPLVGELADYFGLPIGEAMEFSAFWHRAYNLIYNEWFRDENLQDSAVITKGDGPDAVGADYPVRRRGKRQDYFTSSLPFPQKGPDVTLSFGGIVDIQTTDVPPEFYVSGQTEDLPMLQGNVHVGGGKSVDRAWTAGAATDEMIFAAETGLEADLSLATANTINEIREAFQVQRLFERDARGGTRYTEIVRSHFKVFSPDSRLQRPEYLGGGHVAINVNPVANTTGLADPLGELAAYVTAAGAERGFVHSATEHCVVIGLACIRADLNYQQQMNRMWKRETRFDFFWPALQHLGEQEVLGGELYFDADDTITGNLSVFGYQERYAEYRYKPSMITGQFRSDFAQSLDIWHLAQDFGATRPELNSDFIEENPPIARIIATPTEPHWLFDGWFDITHVRPMSTYGVPGLIDHF